MSARRPAVIVLAESIADAGRRTDLPALSRDLEFAERAMQFAHADDEEVTASVLLRMLVAAAETAARKNQVFPGIASAYREFAERIRYYSEGEK